MCIRDRIPIVKGDAKSVSIAAASIMAKVTRDHMMEEYDKLYPEYGFARHKGYGTAAHMEAIRQYGPCPIHRLSLIHICIAARNLSTQKSEPNTSTEDHIKWISPFSGTGI